MQDLNPDDMIARMIERGISPEQIELVKNYCVNLEAWLKGFENAAQSVEATIRTIRNHPLIPKDIAVYGFLIDPSTGRLDPL